MFTVKATIEPLQVRDVEAILILDLNISRFWVDSSIPLDLPGRWSASLRLVAASPAGIANHFRVSLRNPAVPDSEREFTGVLEGWAMEGQQVFSRIALVPKDESPTYSYRQLYEYFDQGRLAVGGL